MNMFEYAHAHALAINEAMLQFRVVWMCTAQIDSFFKEGFRQHLFQARLSRPTDPICRLAKIAIGY